ncbi:MAG: glycosyltransferase family 4 protein [Aggregatilineales bacterium]
MRILFISWWWPYPANNGSKIRVYNLLRQLASAHEIALLAFAASGEATPDHVEHLRVFCRHVEAVPKPDYRPNSLRATAGYLSRWPRSLVDTYNQTMARRVSDLVGAGSVDIVIASELQNMRYLELARGLPAIIEDIEVTGYHDRVRAASGAARARAQLTVNKLEGALHSLMVRGCAVTVVSEQERELVLRAAPPGGRVEVIPNGVDTLRLRPLSDVQPQPFTLIYTGAITYKANLDAVTYFVEDVLPLVRRQFPETRFLVTGSAGNIDTSALTAQPGVTFTGYLPDVAAAVREAWAVVVPLREGGGTRLKVLEAMALGTPVISTRKGAEGLDVRHGANILLADTPNELAEAIATLFCDPALRAGLAGNARRLVEEIYDWSMIGRRLLALVEDVAAAHQ